MIIFSLNCKNVADYGIRTVGVFVMNMEDYLTSFYPSIQNVLDLFYSLVAANSELKAPGE